MIIRSLQMSETSSSKDHHFLIHDLILNGIDTLSTINFVSWQYLFAVTAFDEGDAENNLESLESSSLASLQRIIPGTPASTNADLEIGVYPNPFNPSTIISYSIPKESRVNLKIFNILGQEIKTLVNEIKTQADIQFHSMRLHYQQEFIFTV